VAKKKTSKRDKADFSCGDTVKVHVKIPEEEGKVRIQIFEGIVIRRRGSGVNETFTVRRISYGEGVERVFPLLSPMIDRIELVKKGKVKRSRLYYLRGRKGKKAKVSEQKLGQEQEQEQQTAEV
jgi:large subunit ribosomal protein L19